MADEVYCVINQLIYAICFLVCVAPSVSWSRSAESLFIQHCSGCHGLQGDGGGVLSGVPDFRELVGLFASTEAGRTYVLHVPGVVNASLEDADTARVLNYVMRRWGGRSLANDYRPFTQEEVAKRRRLGVRDVVALRREVVAHLRERGVEAAAYPWP